MPSSVLSKTDLYSRSVASGTFTVSRCSLRAKRRKRTRSTIAMHRAIRDKRKQGGGQRPAIEIRPERGAEKGDRGERDKNRTDAHPALLPSFREGCITRSHGAAAL